jgi:hypothetical protein
MTVSSTTVKNSYSGNSSTTVFAYTFKIFADTDLQVIIRSSTGTETTKTLTTHYTVSGAGDASGGNVTFTSGNTPATGETVVIRRGVPQTQAIDYIANDPFPAESHEEGLDRATMTTQQVQEELDRAIKLSRTNTITSTEFTTSATDRANKVLSFDSSGEIAVAQELGTFKGNSATVTTAAFSVRDIVKATTTAQLNNIYICVADSVIGDSLTDTDHFELLVDAVSAAASATAAATSATASATSATASASSATTSGNSATASASSATAAANSATAAASSATDAANSADAFDDIYLGSKSSDPSTDNDGDALAAGMLYFNTTDDVLRVYTGSAWQNAAVDTTGFITLTGTQTLTNKTLTSPKIGTSILDTNGNELAKVTATSSAVNEFTVANGATGNGPRLSVTGDDGNVDLDLLAKGTGHVTVRGNTNAGAIQLNCESNSHGQIIKSQPHSAGVTNEMLLPAGSSSTLVSLVSTDTLTNKTLTSPKIGTDISDTNGNELLKVTATSSAVNELTLANAATGNNPSLTASGGDTNIGVSILPKGSGKVTIDNLVFPAADGSADQVLKTDGSGNLSFADQSGGGGTSWQSVKTSNFNAAAGEGYFVNTSSGAITATLPASPSIGDTIEFKDYSGSFGTNNLTIDPNGNKFEGLNDTNHTASQNRQSLTITFSDSTKGYVLTASANSTASSNTGLFNIVAPPYTADFLVIAGGSSGGGDFGGGGGGAGGYRASYNSEASGGGGSSESSISITPGTAYTITVGAGGTEGTDSSIAGSGLTTITSIGGGRSSRTDGTEDGGSGGGGNGSGSAVTGGNGTANQGKNGGNGSGGNNYHAGGGGGGAANVGGNGNIAGAPGGGGNGVASTITGSSVTRAGGGGGGQQAGSSGGNASGGNGGGGNGDGSNGNDGTANTGGGGGSGQFNGGSGGSGVVILRVPTANYSGTTTGSPTVTTSGSDTIIQFNSTGSYTA